MKKIIIVLLSLFTLLVSGCQAAVSAPPDAVETTTAFYKWYLANTHHPETGAIQNPLASGAYRESPYLSPELVTQVDGLVAGFDRGGYDPFLLAQDIPQAITVESAKTTADHACVIVHQDWGGFSRDLTAMLGQAESGWQIEAVRRGSPLTPQGAVQLFYDEYLAALSTRGPGGIDDVLTEAVFPTCAGLSPALRTELLETVAGFEQGGFDPVLLAQDIPVSVEAQAAEVEDGEAIVSVASYYGGNPEPAFLNVHVEEADGLWQVTAIVPVEDEAVTGSALGPEAVTAALFAGYLEAGSLAPELAEYLSPEFSAALLGLAVPGYDPLQAARRLPETVRVAEVIREENTAAVLLERSWPGVESWLPLRVTLVEIDGRWLVDGVSPQAAPISETSPAGEAAAAAAGFYTWLLAYPGDPAQGEFRSALADGAYQERPELSPTLKDALAEQLTAGPGYDLLWCAQDIPHSFSTDGAVTSPEGKTARVLLRTSFYEHYLVLDLEQAADRWRIDQVHCPGTAESLGRAFYTWYLGYIGSPGSGSFRNPLSERAYAGSGFLSAGLVAAVDEMLSGSARGGYDPFLLAQDIPQGFEVEPGPEANTAVVTLRYGADAVRKIILTTVEEEGRLRIESIEAFPAP